MNGTQFGTTQGTLSNGGKYTFSGTPFMVPSGNTVNVNVYADTLSSATGTATNATNLSGLSGTGAISFTSISLASSVPGQNVTFAGQAAMSVAADSSEPAATTLTMGSTGNTLAVYRFQETTNIEPVKITDLTVTDVSTSTATTSLPAFSNLQLFSGSTLLGTAGSAVSSGQVCTGGSATTTASAALTVAGTTGLSTTTAYTYYVTVNNVTSPAQSYTSVGNDSTNAVALAIAGVINTNKTSFGLTAGTPATVAGGVITIAGNGGAQNLNPSVALWGIWGSVPATVTQTANTLGANAVAQTCVVSTIANNGTYQYSFHFASPIIVPQANTTLVTLKGDIATYSGGGATDNSSHVFSIAASSDVTALGQTSNKTVSVTGTGSGNAMTVLRSTMTVNTSPSTLLAERQAAVPADWFRHFDGQQRRSGNAYWLEAQL